MRLFDQVRLLHSCSLLAYAQGVRRFDGTSPARRDKLARLLEIIAGLFEPISVAEFRRRLDAGRHGELVVEDFSSQPLAAVDV